ncbi:MAG TPA: FAD-dependent oxidoreductase [Clostridiales bacterium]|nr:FAD-dependent oxidoreductase [Clostridiales bacterium]
MSKLLSMFENLDRGELTYPGGAEQNMDCDIVVVGGGGAGTTAAVRAAELGARVILVEKMSSLGGNSRFAGGLLSTNSEYQKSRGMRDNTDRYIETAYKHHKYTLNPAIFRRYISNSGTYYDWLVKHGLDTENTRWILDDAVCLIKKRTHPGYLGGHPAYGPGLMGSAILDLMKAYIDEKKIPVLLETKVRSLLTENGRVTGVLADGQNASYRINAGAVILSSGGFGGNVEMLRRFLPQYFSTDNYVSHYCLLSTTGDGIEMAEKIGAEVGRNMSVGISAISHIPGTYTVRSIVRQPLGILVNKNGQRFLCEDEADDAEFAMDLQPEGLGYYIYDRTSLLEAFKLAIETSPYGDEPPTWENLETDLLREKEEGKLAISDTLEGLCDYIGCSPEALRETVERCNRHYEQGYDNELFKKKENLRLIKDPPYFAIRILRNFDVTMGGVSINENLQALRPDGTVIPGLYVTGDCASNWMGTEYGPLFSSFAWAMNSGYIAAEEAQKHVKDNN